MINYKHSITAAMLATSALSLTGQATAEHGSGRGLILFDRGDWTGERRYLDQDIDTLSRIQFNDKTQSVAVLEGTWELCEDKNFTGKCIVLRADIDRLKDFGLGDEITSIRRLSDYADVDHLAMVERDWSGDIVYVYDDPYYYSDHGYASYGPTTYYSTSIYYGRDYYGVDRGGFYDHGFGYRHGYRNWYRPGYNNHHYGDSHKYKAPAHIGARNANVTIYADPGLRGRSFGVNRAIPSFGDAGFNDIASSIEIKSGKWEVCDQSYYRGRCQIIDMDQHSLASYKLNDNISSIRPVGDYTPPKRRKGGNDDWNNNNRGDRNHGGGGDWKNRNNDGQRGGNRGNRNNGDNHYRQSDYDRGHGNHDTNKSIVDRRVPVTRSVDRDRVSRVAPTNNQHDRILQEARDRQRQQQIERERREKQQQDIARRNQQEAAERTRRNSDQARQNAERAQRQMTADRIQQYRDQAQRTYQQRQNTNNNQVLSGGRNERGQNAQQNNKPFQPRSQQNNQPRVKAYQPQKTQNNNERANSQANKQAKEENTFHPKRGFAKKD